MTTEFLSKIKELNAQGLNDTAIAEQLHYNKSVVREWRIRLGLPVINTHRTKKLYDIYDGETTQYIMEGTAKECAAYMGVSVSSFHNLKWKFEQGVYKRFEIYDVVEDEDE